MMTPKRPDTSLRLVHDAEEVRVRLLGGFDISVDGQVARDSGRSRAASLIKMLALAPGHRMHREEVSDALWPDLDSSRATSNLHISLHRAREALSFERLKLKEGMVVLCPDEPFRTDVEAFEEAAVEARRTRSPAAYRTAISLYTGELLPEDRLEAWVEERRWRLRSLYLDLLLELARIYEGRRESEAAAGILRDVVQDERTNEEAHVALMRLYARDGNQREALRQFDQMSEALAEDLGASPGVEASLLRREILSEKTPARHEGIAERTDEPHNLPAPLTSFVGRSREVTKVKRSLATKRLLTLTGAGGSGKTRLAVEVARDLVGAYADGVWIVELAPVSDPDLIPGAVAVTLGVRETPGRSLTDALIDHLRKRNLLLLLDNCEHLVEETAVFVDALLRRCENLHILATSREPLGNLGETVWSVPPLSLPGKESSVEQMMDSEAVRLFVERARSRLPNFEITAANAASVARVCRRLDGIPLAIELATARMGALAVEQITARLEDSLKILAVRTTTTEPRHRTMRATIEWSHDLLEEPEKKLFRRLSVFAGGWKMESAEEVCEGNGLKRSEILDLLSRLVEKSLVEPSKEESMRYRMLEPVRQYAIEKLKEHREADRIRERHARHFLEFSQRGSTPATERLVLEGRPPSWHTKMESEYSNLSAALSWSLDENSGAHAKSIGVRLSVALFWLWHSHQREGRRYLNRAASAASSQDAALKARALHGLSWITFFQGAHDESRAMIEEGVALYREVGEPEGLASGLVQFGMLGVLGERDDVPLPKVFEELLSLKPGIENRSTIGYILILEGMAALGGGNLELSQTLHEQALQQFSEAGDLKGTSTCVMHLAAIALVRGDHRKVVKLGRESLHKREDMYDSTMVQLWLIGIGCASLGLGQAERAVRLWGAAEALGEEYGVRPTPISLSIFDLETRFATARSHLGEESFTAMFDEGEAMSIDTAIEYALSGEDELPVPAAQPPELHPSLTSRQREVAILISLGLSNREIASELNLSEHTVTSHTRDVRRKLGVKSRLGVAAELRANLENA